MTGFVEVTCSQTFITVIRFEVWWKTLGFQENVKPERSLLSGYRLFYPNLFHPAFITATGPARANHARACTNNNYYQS